MGLRQHVLDVARSATVEEAADRPPGLAGQGDEEHGPQGDCDDTFGRWLRTHETASSGELGEYIDLMTRRPSAQ